MQLGPKKQPPLAVMTPGQASSYVLCSRLEKESYKPPVAHKRRPAENCAHLPDLRTNLLGFLKLTQPQASRVHHSRRLPCLSCLVLSCVFIPSFRKHVDPNIWRSEQSPWLHAEQGTRGGTPRAGAGDEWFPSRQLKQCHGEEELIRRVPEGIPGAKSERSENIHLRNSTCRAPDMGTTEKSAGDGAKGQTPNPSEPNM
ncbi:uncharacterized protein LOC144338525 [Macaca mulatta]